MPSPLKTNLTLIGMPSAGKSTIGIILAKLLSMNFVDTDVIIQSRQEKSLQDIIDESDYLNLRRIESAVVCSLDLHKHVIATGGSVPYSDLAMHHLQAISTIVFLQVEYPEIVRRLHNFSTRGLARKKNQTLEELFFERQALYRKYADIIFPCNGLTQDEIAGQLARIFSQQLSGCPDSSDHD
ncbi:MAG: shikimate kinase [Desulfobulbus propionicus]|nr:MAG: shikimate kinase [Desulfobulbus propionicus]